MKRTVNFRVTGEPTIHCVGCEQRIDNALRRLPGIQNVQASAQTQRVAVTIDPAQLRLEQIRAKLNQIGYKVELEEGGV